MRMKEYDNVFKKDDGLKVSFRRDNFKDMAAAVEYTEDMILKLCSNLEIVDAAVITAYAELSEIPVNIQAVPEDDYIEHSKALIEVLSRISIAEIYLNDIKRKINEYYDVAAYDSKLKDNINAAINKELVDYVDDQVDDVDVHYDDLSGNPSMIQTNCNNGFKLFKQL